VLQTAIDSDKPGPVRAKIVGERFEGAILFGGLRPFSPAAGSRPERVLAMQQIVKESGRPGR